MKHAVLIVLLFVAGAVGALAIQALKPNVGGGLVELNGTYGLSTATSAQIVVGTRDNTTSSVATASNGQRDLHICQGGGSSEVYICFNATTCASTTAGVVLASTTFNPCVDVSAYQGPIIAKVNSSSSSSTLNVIGSNNGK